MATLSTTSCPECGKPRPAGAPDGMCPSCLLRLGQLNEATAGEVTTFDEAPIGEVPGLSIGRYRLLEPIGEGGYGTVWMAEQLEPVRRRVALKLIKLGMDTKQVVARFEAERQALALMDHQNIARVFDGGATESGRPYFVMELVRGIPLTTYCDTTRLNVRERVELFIQVCQAVQHAHQKGIIHRDLKPSNVLVTEQDGKPLPKVIDFGIAKATEVVLTEKTVFTRFNQMIGTPAYMSPEQAGLGSLDIDTRTDIYSLGVLLYELLTGRTPLDPQKLRSSGYEAMLKTIREVEPAKPSTCLSTLKLEEMAAIAGQRREEPHRFRSLVRGDLDWIALKALEKDRTRRYASASDLAADLQRFLNSEPILARPPSNLYRFRKLARRNKLAFAAGGAVLTALVVGLMIATWQAVRARQAEQISRQRAYAAEMNAAFQAWQEDRVVPARALLEAQRPGTGRNAADLRGFDWRYLWKVTQPAELFTLTNAAFMVFGLSPDGETLAGVVGGHLRLWSLPKRREITTLLTNADVMFAIPFSPDGRQLAVPWSGKPNLVEIWDLPTQSVIHQLQLDEPPLGIAFSPDGTHVAVATGVLFSADRTGAVSLWNPQTEVKVWEHKFPRSWLLPVKFSPDGQILATAGGDGVVRLWAAATGVLARKLEGHNGYVGAVTFSHDGKFVAVGDEQGFLWIWNLQNLQSERPEVTFKAHERAIWSIEFSADDERLLTGSSDFAAKLWDRSTRREIWRFAGHNSAAVIARFLPGDQFVATGSMDNHVKVWNTPTTVTENILARTTNNAGLVFTSGGRYLASIDYDGQWITFFDPAIAAHYVASWPGKELAASADGKHLAVLQGTNLIFLDPVRLDEIGRVPIETQLGGRPSFSPDGRWLAFRRSKSMDATGDRAPTLAVVVDVAARCVLTEIATDDDHWAPLFFACGGRLLLTVGQFSQPTRVWDTSAWPDWRLVRPLDATLVASDGVALSTDGRIFAEPGNDGRIRLWNLERLEEEPALTLNAGTIYTLAFDPDDTSLAVGTIDGIRLWNLSAQQEVAILKGHRSYVQQLAFSPDGRSLASSGTDKEIRLWQAPTFDEIRAAEASSNAGPRPPSPP